MELTESWDLQTQWNLKHKANCPYFVNKKICKNIPPVSIFYAFCWKFPSWRAKQRFLSIIWSIDGTRLARLAKRQSLHGEGFVVGKNVWSAPTKLGKDGHYRDSLPRQRARSYHQYWPTSPSRSFAECVRNVMIRVLMDTQTCSKCASQMHIYSCTT